MSNVIEFSIKALDDFSATMGKFGTSLSKTEQAFAALGVTAAAYAALRLAKASLDNADAMGVAAEKANMTVVAFSELAWAAKMANVDQGSLASGVKFLNRAISEGDLSPAGRQLAALGIAAKDANGNLRKTEDVMMDVADAFRNGAQDGNKTKIAMELLGRSGTEMVPFLNQGSAAIREAREEAIKLGVVIDDDFTQSANQINDNLDKMSQMLSGSVSVALKSVAPAIEALTKQYIDLAVESGGITKTGEQIATAFRLIASAAIVVAAIIQALGDAIGAVAAAAVAAATGDFSGAAKILSAAYSKSVDIVNAKMTELDVVWDKNVKSAAAVSSATEKMANSHKKSMKTVGDADLEAKRIATEYAGVYKRLTELLKASETPFDTHARKVREITQLQKDLGGTSDELTAALQRENAEWDKAKIATDEYKNSATSVMSTMNDMYSAEMKSIGSVAYQVAQTMLDTWHTTTKGIGDAVGQSLVYGSSLKDGIESLAKQIIAALISAFVQIGVQRLVLMSLSTGAYATEAAAATASASVQVAAANSVAAAWSLASIAMVGAAGLGVGALSRVGEDLGGGTGTLGGTLGGFALGGMTGETISTVGDILGFAGGGYTGAGVRAGGVDGRGGFPAILHPNETVIDHEMGGGGGGTVIQNLTIHVLENATNTDAFRNMNRIELRNALGQPVVDALNEMFSIGVRPNFAMVNR